MGMWKTQKQTEIENWLYLYSVCIYTRSTVYMVRMQQNTEYSVACIINLGAMSPIYILLKMFLHIILGLPFMWVWCSALVEALPVLLQYQGFKLLWIWSTPTHICFQATPSTILSVTLRCLSFAPFHFTVIDQSSWVDLSLVSVVV